MRALRDAVAAGREGQAYLFSGPRGTGKTTSARILAKVLNCERPVDGEPCCECESCLAVEQGTSYDVHELDAASNNKVENMRDLIEKAALGTPGRHRVYILDEVHMLTPAAEAALLKTLEEPPPHVVFVLATTDPQQGPRHDPQPHAAPALPPARRPTSWPPTCAGWRPMPGSTSTTRRSTPPSSQGGGSARDTLSALELIASSGGDAGDALSFDEFLEALVDHDRRPRPDGDGPRRERRPRAAAARRGARAPPAQRLPVADGARARAAARRSRSTSSPRRPSALGPAALVRAIERLGEILVELRHAPDPRVLVEVALVQLTSVPDASTSDDIGPLAARVTALEQALAAGAAPAASGRAQGPDDGAHGARRAGHGAPRTPPMPRARRHDPRAGRRHRPSHPAAGGRRRARRRRARRPPARDLSAEWSDGPPDAQGDRQARVRRPRARARRPTTRSRSPRRTRRTATSARACAPTSRRRGGPPPGAPCASSW